MYKVRKSNKKDFNKIYFYVSNTYFKYNNVDKEEKDILINYTKREVKENINDYNMIMINNSVIGLYLIRSYEDGILLDDIFIEEEYRNKGIASSIIKTLQLNEIIYLNVYKDNINALNLYKKLGFEIIEENMNRYKMKSNKIEKSNL